MRSFLAIELPDAVRDHLVRAQKILAPRIGKASLTRPENLHITLKFLGELRDNELEPLIESLQAVKASSAIKLRATGIACFPDRGPVRIIAGMFGGDDKALLAIHSAIEQRCQYLGFDREQRKYTPHATLARARPILPAITRDIASRETQRIFPGPEFKVSEFVLMQSALKPTGAEYAVAARFALLT